MEKPPQGAPAAPAPAPAAPPAGAKASPEEEASQESAVLVEPQPALRKGPAHAPPPAPAREPSARALRYREHRIPRRHRVFVNRNLKMTTIRAIGFDLDHTLALRSRSGRGARVRSHEA